MLLFGWAELDAMYRLGSFDIWFVVCWKVLRGEFDAVL